MYGTEHAINLNLKTWKYMKDLLDDIKRRMDVSKLIYDRENRTEGHLRLKNENYGKYKLLYNFRSNWLGNCYRHDQVNEPNLCFYSA